MVRDATAHDVPAIRDLATKLALRGSSTGEVLDREITRALEDERSVLVVADEAGDVVGYLLGVLAPMPVHGGMALVQELLVRDDRRRAGVGAALMAAFEERARSAGAGVVSLATSRAGAFYEALGYAPAATYYRRTLS